MLTLAQNNVAMMRLLLKRGADPTLEGEGHTPLQLACGSGACAVVRLLLDHGVDPDEKMRVDEWWTPMCAAAAYNQVEVIRMLLDHGASTGLVRTARRWRYGGTPLGTACAHGHVDAARLLLDNGADIELKDHGRSTPLVSALDNAMPAVVRLLLARGADVERRVEVQDKDNVLHGAGDDGTHSLQHGPRRSQMRRARGAYQRRLRPALPRALRRRRAARGARGLGATPRAIR